LDNPVGSEGSKGLEPKKPWIKLLAPLTILEGPIQGVGEGYLFQEGLEGPLGAR